MDCARQGADVGDAVRVKQENELMRSMNAIYELVEAGYTLKAMVAVFRTVNDAMSSGSATNCDLILQSVDLARLNADTILAFLSSTYPGRTVLPSRRHLYDMAFPLLVSELGDARANDVAGRMK